MPPPTRHRRHLRKDEPRPFSSMARVHLTSPSLTGHFFPFPSVTGPLGQGILQRGPEPALWRLSPCDQNQCLTARPGRQLGYRKNACATLKKSRNRSSSAVSICRARMRRRSSGVSLNSSRLKSSARGMPKAAAKVSTLVRDGFRRPRSISPMYWRDNPESSANFSWVMSRLRRIVLIFLPKSS